MQNQNCLPFPEPSNHDIDQATIFFMEKYGGITGYTEEMARREATTYLVFGQAMLSGFLQESGRVILGPERSFSMRPRTPSEKD